MRSSPLRALAALALLALGAPAQSAYDDQVVLDDRAFARLQADLPRLQSELFAAAMAGRQRDPFAAARQQLELSTALALVVTVPLMLQSGQPVPFSHRDGQAGSIDDFDDALRAPCRSVLAEGYTPNRHRAQLQGCLRLLDAEARRTPGFDARTDVRE
ncbi:MAG: hypothetical protein IPM29_00665 [Planctomycetes bacterium]|nr:hypothetical protein [Planctomycetota bacterium]